VAARSLGVAADAVELAAATPGFRVYQTGGEAARPMRTVDWSGAIRAQRSRALVRATTAVGLATALPELWRRAGGGEGPAAQHPGLVLLFDRHLVDLTGVEDLAQTMALAASELEGRPADTPVALVAMPAGASG
jgi:hypothetical protein